MYNFDQGARKIAICDHEIGAGETPEWSWVGNRRSVGRTGKASIGS